MKRRIIAALAAAGLAVTMAVAVAPAAQATVVWGDPYVAVGDSLAAGTGNVPYVDEACNRSKKAYPNMLAGLLGEDVVSRACAGSSTAQVTGQVAALAGAGTLGAATELVTITAGVNNLPWIQILGACSNQVPDPATCGNFLSNFPLPVMQFLVAPGVAEVIGAVRAAAPFAQIVVTGYPRLFGTFEGTCNIGAVEPGAPMSFSAENAALLNQAADRLNLAIQSGIALYQQAYFAQTGQQDTMVHWVDVTDEFLTHGLCDTGERWIGGMVPQGPADDRGFHPNVAGQRAYAAAIAEELMP